MADDQLRPPGTRSDPLYGTPPQDPAWTYYILHGGDPPTHPPPPVTGQPAPPPPNPQIGVETLPPPNTSDPAPLPGSEFTDLILPYGPSVPEPLPPHWQDMPDELRRLMREAPDTLRWEYDLSENTILVGPRGTDTYSGEEEFVWGWFPLESGSRQGTWELLDPGEWLMPRDPRDSFFDFGPRMEPNFVPRGLMQIVDPNVRRAPGGSTVFGGPPPIFGEGTPPVPSPPGAERRTSPAQRPGPASGGWSMDVFREMAERMLRDTVIRKGAERVIRRVPGIGTATRIFEGEILDPGTVPWEERIQRNAPTIPEPVFEQPPPRPLPPPPIPEITPPWPTPSAPSTSSAPSPATAPAPTSPPTPAPTRRPAPAPSAFGQLAGLWTNVIRQRTPSSSRLRMPFTDPLTQAFSDSVPRVYGAVGTGSPPKFGMPTSPTPTPTSLTGFNMQVLGSTPPRTPTRTRTREDKCDCKPKKRKKERECMVRGNLQWTSGPKKGKPAGSRCVNFRG